MATNASGTTTNLGLSQWIREDAFRMEDFNADNLALDNAYATLTAAIATAVSNGLKVETGTYTGTGTYGSSYKTEISFDITPYFLFVFKQSPGYPYTVILSGVTSALAYSSGTYPQSIGITWGNGVVKLLASLANWQMNDADTTYRYIVLGT